MFALALDMRLGVAAHSSWSKNTNVKNVINKYYIIESCWNSCDLEIICSCFVIIYVGGNKFYLMAYIKGFN